MEAGGVEEWRWSESLRKWQGGISEVSSFVDVNPNLDWSYKQL
jgi:hypothetical protein